MLNELQLKFLQFWNYLNSAEFLNLFFNNRFYLIFLVVVLVHIKNFTYKSMFMAALINIPGTLLHEFMHFIVGLLLNARPCNFSIFPKKVDGGYIMGSVGFRHATFYNALPSAMAPLALLPLGFYLNRYMLSNLESTLLNGILYVLLQTIIIENAMPSRTDFKVAGMFFSGIIFYAVLGIAAIILL